MDMRSSVVGLRALGAVLVAILIVFAIILVIGARWGTRKPTPGRSQPEIVCGHYGDCVTR